MGHHGSQRSGRLVRSLEPVVDPDVAAELIRAELATVLHVPLEFRFCRYRSKSVPVPVRLPVCVPETVLV